MRVELGLPSDATVLLFVGRMTPLKNPTFVVEMLASILPHVPSAYAVFVGSGDLSDLVELEAQSLGVKDRIRMLGWRDDTAELMANSDLFVFPRLEHPKEGLGLVVVEAQAAGLPMLLSPGIPEDAIVVPELFHTLPLRLGPGKWAEKAADILSQERIKQTQSLERVADSRFSMTRSVHDLMQLYNFSDSSRSNPFGDGCLMVQISQIVASGSQYLIATNHQDTVENIDILTGYWRPLNLTNPPFNLPQPFESIAERSTENPDKVLAVWKVEDIAERLGRD